MSLTPIGDLLIAIRADVDDYHKAAATAGDVTRGLKGTFHALGRAVRNTGAIITGMAAITTAAIGAVSSAGAQLEFRLAEIATITDMTRAESEELADTVDRVATKWGVQGGQVAVAEAAYNAFSASMDDVAGKQGFLEQSAKLATAGFIEMGEAGEVLATVLNAYRMEAEEADRVSNVLFKTVQEGVITMDEIASSIGPLLPFANELGVSIEEVGVAMSQMTKAGIPAKRAVTSLRSAFQAMLDPTDELAKHLADIAEAQGIMPDGMKAARQELQNMEKQVSSTKESIEGYEEELEALREGKRGVNEDIDEMRDQLQGQEQDLKSAQEEYDRLGQRLNELRNDMDELTQSMRTNRIQIAEIRLAARKEGRELTEAEKQQIEELEIQQDELRLSQMRMQNQSADLREEQEESQDALQSREEQVEQTKDAIEEAVDSEIRSLEDRIEKEKDALEGQEERLEDAQENWDGYKDKLGDVVMEHNNFFDVIQELEDRVDDSNDSMTDLFPNIRGLTAILQFMGEGGEEAAEAFKGEWQDIGDIVSDAAEEARSTTVNKWRRMKNQVAGIAQDIGEAFQEPMRDAIDYVSGIIDRLRERFGDMDEQTKENISKFIMLATALGLVLGPLLILAGQFAIIASVIGAGGLLALTGGLIVTLGVLGVTLREVVSGGEESEEALNDLKETIQAVIDIAKTLYTIITEDLLPGFIDLGKGVIDVMAEIIDAFAELGKETGITTEEIRVVTGAFGDLLSKIGTFLSDNSELVAALVIAAGTFYTLMQAVAVAKTAYATYLALQSTALIPALFFKIGVLYQTAVAWLAAMGPIPIIIGLIALFVGLIATDFMGIRSIIENVLGTLINYTRRVIEWFKGLSTMMKIVVAVMFLPITVTLYLIEALMILKNWLMNLATGGLTTFKAQVLDTFGTLRDIAVAVIEKVIDLVIGLKKVFMKVVDAYISIWLGIFDALREVLLFFRDIISKVVSFLKKRAPSKLKRAVKKLINTGLFGALSGYSRRAYNWGKNMIDEIKNGITDSARGLKDKAGDAAGAIEDVLAVFSDADEGPLSNITEWGPNMIHTIASGMEDEKGKLKQIFQELGMAPHVGDLPGPSVQVVQISDGAVIFEQGAFQGVSDDEIPQLVGEEVDQTLTEIVEDIEGAGK